MHSRIWAGASRVLVSVFRIASRVRPKLVGFPHLNLEQGHDLCTNRAARTRGGRDAGRRVIFLSGLRGYRRPRAHLRLQQPLLLRQRRPARAARSSAATGRTDCPSSIGRLQPNQRNVRVTLTAPAYDDSGNLIFYAPVALFGEEASRATTPARCARDRTLVPHLRVPAGGERTRRDLPEAAGVARRPARRLFLERSARPVGPHVRRLHGSARSRRPRDRRRSPSSAARNGFDLDGTPIITDGERDREPGGRRLRQP